MQWFWDLLNRIFGSHPVLVTTPPPLSTAPPIPVPLPVTQPLPVQNPPISSGIDWMDWCNKAIAIVQVFEGDDPWANITGNFDGCYLTCGSLGFTWKYNNQIPMIWELLKKAGTPRAKELMPTCWDEYMSAVTAGETAGGAIVAKWSNGSANVKEPYLSELRRFWKSPEMVEIQTSHAWTQFGMFAQKKCLESQQYFKMSAPQFSHFVYWFDQAVLNGTSKTINFGDTVTFDVIQSWVPGGYAADDLKANKLLWAKQYPKASSDQQILFQMAYLRAVISGAEFKGVVMNRRGTLALGLGMVDGDQHKYPWQMA